MTDTFEVKKVLDERLLLKKIFWGFRQENGLLNEMFWKKAGWPWVI